MEFKILYHVDIINSKQDFYGNCYWCMIVTDNQTGNRASGKISGDYSNIEAGMLEICKHWDRFTKSNIEVSKREFHRITTNMKYVGCCADEIAFNILGQLTEGE